VLVEKFRNKNVGGVAGWKAKSLDFLINLEVQENLDGKIKDLLIYIEI